MKLLIFILICFYSLQIFAKESNIAYAKNNDFEYLNIIQNKMAYGEFTNTQIEMIKKQILSSNCSIQDEECEQAKLVSMQFLTFIRTEETENKGQLNTYQSCSNIEYKKRKDYCYGYTNVYGAILLSQLLKNEMNDVSEEVKNTAQKQNQEKIYQIYQSHIKVFMNNMGFLPQEQLMTKRIFSQALSNKYTLTLFQKFDYMENHAIASNLINTNIILLLYSSINIQNLNEVTQTEKNNKDKENDVNCKYLFLFKPYNKNLFTCSIH